MKRERAKMRNVRRARGNVRASLLACLALTLAQASCIDDCKPSPGLCPPSASCVNGYRQTGAATCESGQWVCGRVACVADAGPCDGPCPDSSSR